MFGMIARLHAAKHHAFGVWILATHQPRLLGITALKRLLVNYRHVEAPEIKWISYSDVSMAFTATTRALGLFLALVWSPSALSSYGMQQLQYDITPLFHHEQQRCMAQTFIIVIKQWTRFFPSKKSCGIAALQHENPSGGPQQCCGCRMITRHAIRPVRSRHASLHSLVSWP